MKCPNCKKFMRKLKDNEKLQYIGGYQYGMPNSTAVLVRIGCWGYCKTCGYQDP